MTKLKLSNGEFMSIINIKATGFFHRFKNRYGVWVLYFFLSLIVSFLWMIIAKDHYTYNHNFTSFMGISLFPLLGLATGLFTIYAIFTCLYYSEKRGYFVQLLLFSIFYWSLLIATETIGYHFLNIKNLAAASYPGIPICDCLHAPIWMKIAYFSMGPLFFFICSFINLYYSKAKKCSRMGRNTFFLK